MTKPWIAPGALIFAQLAHGFSWALILWAAWSGNADDALTGFAWIHTVALGWFTMAALAIVIFALPNFIDTEWRGENVARWSLAVFGIGVVALVYGFLNAPAYLGAASAIVLAALLVYLATAFATVAAGIRGERIERAVARAFGGTFVFLLLTALFGVCLAFMLSGTAVPQWVTALPPVHANLGTLGWLTLLVFGVSMRTLRPITGDGSRFRWIHIVGGSLAVAGIPILAIGSGVHSAALAWLGACLYALAAIAWAFDALDILRRATVTHRPPQAFAVAAVVWLLASLVLGAGVLMGESWERAYVFVLLAGWIGQMVNAHMLHIGIRLLATIYRGDEDETRPQALLESRLSWFTLYAFQAAIIIVLVALLQNSAGNAARGAVFGLTGWIATIANILTARLKAKSMPRTIRL